MRKIGYFLLMLIICFNIHNFKVSANSDILVKLVYSSFEVKKSEEFTIQIVLEDYVSLYQSDVYILVDPKKLEILEGFTLPVTSSMRAGMSSERARATKKILRLRASAVRAFHTPIG